MTSCMGVGQMLAILWKVAMYGATFYIGSIVILAVSEGFVQCRTPQALLKNWLPLFHYQSLKHLSSLPTKMEYKRQKLVEHMLQAIICFISLQ